MKVCDIYNKILEDIGTYYIYGLPGSFIMPIWKSISGKNKLLLTRHESGAVFMADGYARATGKLGIAITTVGPGVTNSITGITCAYQDSIPLLILAGMGPLTAFGKGMFQNSDPRDRGFSPLDMLKPITKKCYLPRTGEEAIENLYEAIQIANSGRKGPVHISLPLDVQGMDINWQYSNKELNPIDDIYTIDKSIIEVIKKYKKPIILCGWGTYLSGAGEELVRLSQKTQIPIVATVKGITACSEENELYIGIVGNVMREDVRQTIVSYEPDLVISIGSSLSMNSCAEYDTLFKNAATIQVDIEQSQFNLYRKTEYQIKSDAKKFVGFLLQYADQIKNINSIVKKQRPIIVKEDNYFSKIINVINDMIPKESVVLPDAGNHWLDVLYWYQPKNIFGLTTNNGLASMGHAIGSAIGIACALQEKKVICVTGDGSLLMSGGELSTAVNYGINIMFIVANNSGLGRVRQYQIANKQEIKGSLIEFVSIEQYAKGLGAETYSCSTINDFKTALSKCLESKATSVIEVLLDKNDCPKLLK